MRSIRAIPSVRRALRSSSMMAIDETASNCQRYGTSIPGGDSSRSMISRAMIESRRNASSLPKKEDDSARYAFSEGDTKGADTTTIPLETPTIRQDAVHVLPHGTGVTIHWHWQDDDSDNDSDKKHGRQTIQTIAAPWLWMQDPAWIHPTSGQRLRTLGQYSSIDAAIVHASFILHIDESDSGDTSVSKVPLHPPPPPGSYHPRGGVYTNTDDDDDDDDEPSGADRIVLQITWFNGTKSYFDADWIQQFAPFSQSNAGMTMTSTTTSRVTQDIAIGASHNSNAVPMPTLEYRRVMTTDHGRLETLQGIVQHGAVLIQNCPVWFDSEGVESDQVVADMGKHLSGGRLSHGSLYGDTFRVVSQPNANNIAYTTVALPPHQDLTYYESKPFLQLLQCVSNAVTGGASILIDAMAAAEHLKIVAPDCFETLCRVEATFVKQRPGADMVSFKPHIVTSWYNQDVVEINWSPPFEGPPVVGESIEEMEEYIRAYQAMECLLNNQMYAPLGSLLLDAELQKQLQSYAHDFTWEYTMHPGEMLIFNNQRMCHGRRAFTLQEEGPSFHLHHHDDDGHQRHLIGCYTDAMETINEYRLLERSNQEKDRKVHRISPTVTRENKPNWTLRNFGNGSRAR